jgi:hypothetical protein
VRKKTRKGRMNIFVSKNRTKNFKPLTISSVLLRVEPSLRNQKNGENGKLGKDS